MEKHFETTDNFLDFILMVQPLKLVRVNIKVISTVVRTRTVKHFIRGL